MSRELPVDSFEWKKDMFSFDKGFINSYDKRNETRHIFEADVKYSKHLHELHINLTFFTETLKISKCNKHV